MVMIGVVVLEVVDWGTNAGPAGRACSKIPDKNVTLVMSNATMVTAIQKVLANVQAGDQEIVVKVRLIRTPIDTAL